MAAGMFNLATRTNRAPLTPPFLFGTLGEEQHRYCPLFLRLLPDKTAKEVSNSNRLDIAHGPDNVYYGNSKVSPS